MDSQAGGMRCGGKELDYRRKRKTGTSLSLEEAPEMRRTTK